MDREKERERDEREGGREAGRQRGTPVTVMQCAVNHNGLIADRFLISTMPRPYLISAVTVPLRQGRGEGSLCTLSTLEGEIGRAHV